MEEKTIMELAEEAIEAVVEEKATKAPPTRPSPLARLKSSIAAGQKMVRDANLETVPAKWLGCKLSYAAPELQKNLALSVHTHPQTLVYRQSIIRELREKSPQLQAKWNKRFEEVHQLEKDLLPFFKKTSEQKEDLEEDALAQLSFQHSLLKPLNHIPWMIALIAAFKVWVVPTITVLFPILAWILPYLLLKFVYTLPISQEQYFTVLKSLWSGSLGGAGGAGGGAGSLEEMAAPPWSSKSLFQLALFAFSFLQSLIQPIQNAMHLHTTDSIFKGVGEKLTLLSGHIKAFRDDMFAAGLPRFKLSLAIDNLYSSDYRRSFILIKEQPERLTIVLRDLANLELLWRIAETPVLNPVHFKKEEFSFTNAIDISIASSKVVPSSLQMQLPSGEGASSGAKPHAVITGPNGGGKSSFLRAILQTSLFGHTYGYAPAEKVTMPRFLWIASGLQLRDTPGELSMFETEVKYAAEILKNAQRGQPGLVLFDELFHSTNPPDGTRTAQVFLHQLWASKSCFSVVSTHVFPLIETAPEGVQAICCPATETKGGGIQYNYAVEPGICRVSSVKKVWERFGLSPRLEEQNQNLPVKEKSADKNVE